MKPAISTHIYCATNICKYVNAQILYVLHFKIYHKIGYFEF